MPRSSVQIPGYVGPAAGCGGGKGGSAPRTPSTRTVRLVRRDGHGRIVERKVFIGAVTEESWVESLAPAHQGWQMWWMVHRDRILRDHRGTRVPGSADGGGERVVSGTSVGLGALRPADHALIHETLRVAAKQHWGHTRAAAAIALGRTCRVSPDSDSERVLLDLQTTDGDFRVRAAASIGLGLFGEPRHLPRLLALGRGLRPTDDRPKSRPSIRSRERCFALLAIGLIGMQAPDAMPAELTTSLFSMIRDEDNGREVTVAAAIALQLTMPAIQHEQVMGLASDVGVDPYVRAHLLHGLGHERAHATLGTIVEAMNDAEPYVARAATVAAGNLVRSTDSAPGQVLVRRARSGSLAHGRLDAIMALGERRLPGSDAILMEILDGPGPPMARISSGIALARCLRNSSAIEARSKAADLLLAAWSRERLPSDRGGIALALGLLGHSRASTTLRRVFLAPNKISDQPDLLLPLALLGERDLISRMRGLVVPDRAGRSSMAASEALRVLGDAGAAEMWNAILDSGRLSTQVLLPAMHGLVAIGGREAIAGFASRITAADGGGWDKSVRALATVGLGLITLEGRPSMLVRARERIACLAQTRELAEFLRIL